MEDFALRVERTPQKFQENFEAALTPLATILSLEIPKDELAKAKVIQQVNEHYAEDDGNFPCLQFSDVSMLTAATKIKDYSVLK